MIVNPNHDNRPVPQAEEAPISRHNGHECFHRLKDEIDDWPEAKIIKISVDVAVAGNLVLTGRSGWRPFLKHADKFPGLDSFYPRECANFAAAAIYAHNVWLAQELPIDTFTAMIERLQDTRANLFADLAALAQRGILSGPTLQKVRGGNGQEALGLYVLFLCVIARNHYHHFEGRCSITTAELIAAEDLASQFLELLARRQEEPVGVLAGPALTRAKAFSAMVFAYGEVQRVVTFVRWQEGDASVIAPSIYAGRGGGSKSSDDATTTAGNAASGNPSNAGTAGTSAKAATVATGTAQGTNVAAPTAAKGSSLIVPDPTPGSLPGVADNPFKT